MKVSSLVKLGFDHEQPADAEMAAKLETAPLEPEQLAEITTILQRAGKKAPAIIDASKMLAEDVEIDPRLSTFKADFDADPTLQSKISWTEIQTRLLANEGHYLALAQAMEQGGELFGIDAEGNPLISDGGDELVMKGMNYADTRARVRFKHTSNNKAGTMIKGEDGRPISTGYEMFGYVEPYGKSDEIIQYEDHTGKKFVQNSREWRSSWLESGENPGSPENPSWPRFVFSLPNYARSHVDSGAPQGELRLRGVRRLLRVKKKA